MCNYSSYNNKKESLLEVQPDDIKRHVCSFLDFKDILRLEQTSSYFNKVKQYITYIKIVSIFSDDDLILLCKIIKKYNFKRFS